MLLFGLLAMASGGNWIPRLFVVWKGPWPEHGFHRRANKWHVCDPCGTPRQLPSPLLLWHLPAADAGFGLFISPWVSTAVALKHQQQYVSSLICQQRGSAPSTLQPSLKDHSQPRKGPGCWGLRSSLHPWLSLVIHISIRRPWRKSLRWRRTSGAWRKIFGTKRGI